MFTTQQRIHFGFSDWTIGSISPCNPFKGWIHLTSLCYLLLVLFHTTCVDGQRVVRPGSVPSYKLPSTSSPLPPLPPPSSLQPCPKCPYTSEDILGVIVTSVIVTIVVIGLTLLLFWFLWKKKLITSPGNHHSIRDIDLNDKTIQQSQTGSQQSPHPNHLQQSQPAHPNGTVLSNEDKQYKRLIKSLPPLTSVFNHISNHSKGGPIKSLDDTFILTKPEQVSVQMTGHDFTGLGFNICGNMRDGIFIKDVLTRGPANESGLIKAGDRIVSITVSCEKMVYEDALTILSYASPYDVTLQVEKTSKVKSTSPNLSGNGHLYMPRRYANGYGSPSDPANQRILHPMFRSQSVGELTTRLSTSEGKASLPSGCPEEEKTFGSIKSINSLLRKIKSSLYKSTASIKSNQSYKLGKMAESDYCSTNNFNDVNGGYHHSCYSLDASALMNGPLSTSSSYRFPSSMGAVDSIASEELVININPKETIPIGGGHLSGSSSPSLIGARMAHVILSNGAMLSSTATESIAICPSNESQRGKLNQGKRKAPSPPSPSTSSVGSIELKSIDNQNNNHVTDGRHANRKETRSGSPGGSVVETHAVIHQEQDNSEDFVPQGSISPSSGKSTIKSPVDVSLSLAMESLSAKEPEATPEPRPLIKEINNGFVNRNIVVRAASPTSGKSKSCSLSDLTLVKNKKTLSAITLERAVSLDMKDQLGPEKNSNLAPTGAILEDNQGLLRWGESKPTLTSGPDSLSTTYSSDVHGSNGKTYEDFTNDDSLSLNPIDELPDDNFAPKPAERTSLKRDSLTRVVDPQLRSSGKSIESQDMTINEEEPIVAPPAGFGSDVVQPIQTDVSSKPSVEDAKLKPPFKLADQPSPYSRHSSSDKKEKPLEGKNPFHGDDNQGDPRNDPERIRKDTHSQIPVLRKPSIPEKPFQLTQSTPANSPSVERLDSTLFDVPRASGLASTQAGPKNNQNNNNNRESSRPGAVVVERKTLNNNENERKVVSVNKLPASLKSKFEPAQPEILRPLELNGKSNRVLFPSKVKGVHGNGTLNNPKPAPNGTVNHPGEAGNKVNSPPTIIQIGEDDFESWSYISDTEGNLPSLSSSHETQHFKTTCDMGQLTERN